jgi:peptidoglycan hydrolase CwlO-like protein
MNKLELISEKITNFVGTPVSILIHTFLFIGIFMLKFIGYSVDQILLILTTVVSLEAIYLSIFIQMSVNKTSKSLAGVEKDIDNIQEDVDDIHEDVEDLNSDEEEEEDEMIKTIQDIEKRLTLLHKEIVEISNKKN